MTVKLNFQKNHCNLNKIIKLRCIKTNRTAFLFKSKSDLEGTENPYLQKKE